MVNDINVNNVAYSWNDIEIHFTGLNIDPIGVSAINYSTTDNNQYVYSRQGLPVARQHGPSICSASITLDYYEIVKLRSIFNITSVLAFDVKIKYNKEVLTNYTNQLDSALGTSGITASYTDYTFIDTLYGCKFSFPDNLGGDQGTMNLTATLELNPVWIKYGNTVDL